MDLETITGVALFAGLAATLLYQPIAAMEVSYAAKVNAQREEAFVKWRFGKDIKTVSLGKPFCEGDERYVPVTCNGEEYVLRSVLQPRGKWRDFFSDMRVYIPVELTREGEPFVFSHSNAPINPPFTR